MPGTNPPAIDDVRESPLGYSARWFLYGCALSFVSLGVTQTYAGTILAVLVGLAVVGVGWRFLPVMLEWADRCVSDVRAKRMALCVFVVVGLATWQLHEVAQSGRFGPGADSDDALVTGVYELAKGRYPYYAQTYLGNPISPLPGALLLASPFVALGCVALGHVFWLFAFYQALARSTSHRGALVAVLALVSLSLGVVHQLVTGVDYGSNALYVLLSAWALLWAARPAGNLPLVGQLVLAAAHGLTLSSRANFLLLLPLLFSRLWQQVGFRRSASLIGVVGASFVGSTLPFYLYDPEGFSPFHVANKLTIYSEMMPGVSVLLPGAAGLLALFLARPSWNADLASFFRNCALVQAIPAIGVVVLESFRTGAPQFGMASYEIFSLYFVVGWCWLSEQQYARTG